MRFLDPTRIPAAVIILLSGSKDHTACADKSVKVWNAQNKECVVTHNHPEKVTALAVGKKTEMLATGTSGGNMINLYVLVNSWFERDEEEAFHKVVKKDSKKRKRENSDEGEGEKKALLIGMHYRDFPEEERLWWPVLEIHSLAYELKNSLGFQERNISIMVDIGRKYVMPYSFHIKNEIHTFVTSARKKDKLYLHIIGHSRETPLGVEGVDGRPIKASFFGKVMKLLGKEISMTFMLDVCYAGAFFDFLPKKPHCQGRLVAFTQVDGYHKAFGGYFTHEVLCPLFREVGMGGEEITNNQFYEKIKSRMRIWRGPPYTNPQMFLSDEEVGEHKMIGC
ncbi:hypothetical protein OROGR_011374 [Orobanche gracilis]